MKLHKPSISAIHSVFKKFKIKKILLYTLLVFVLLLPFQLARLSFQNAQNETNRFSVSIYQKDGTLIASESGTVESSAKYSLIDFFYNIHTTKKEVTYAPGDPSADPYITASIEHNGSPALLKCYFSLDGTSDYLIDENGKIYTVSSIHTQNFIFSPYAASFYVSSAPPLLRSINGDTIQPSRINWNYKTSANKFITGTSISTTSQIISYDVTGEIGLRFEAPPTQCTASVYDGERLIYKGSFNGLSTIVTDTKRALNVKITATWKQNTSSDFYGTVQYDFMVRVQNTSSFSIDPDTTYPGGWVLLSATNISDLSKIRFQADWCSTPVFCTDGSRAYALLPVPSDTTDFSLGFEVSHGASSQAFQIAITTKPNKETAIDPSKLLGADLLTEATTQDILSAIQSVPTISQSYFYPQDTFEDPLQAGYSIGYRHEDTIKGDSEDSFRLIGTEFVTEATLPQHVASWNHGKVLKVGSSASLGRYVVVDHGGGLRIWYCHLNRASVSVGDVVQKGQSVGLTDTDGIATGNGFLVICAINHTVISPESIMGKTFPF